MSSSDDLNETGGVSRRRRKRRNSSLLLLAAGFLLFAAAAGALYYALQPLNLRVAVGPPGSDDHKLIQAMAETFTRDRSHVRLSPITTDGAVQSLTLLGAAKADLAVARGDLDMPAEAETVAIVRKNFVVLWSTSGIPVKGAKKPPAPKINESGDLSEHRGGVIGRTPAKAAYPQSIPTEPDT